jgi:AraC-like DNA-binding protein
MLWRSPSHPISLSRPPGILRMSGRAVHGLRGPEHYRLDRFWCLNLFQGEGELSIDGKIFPFRSGYAGITWPDAELIYTFRGKTIKTWAHFIPKRGGSPMDIPIMQDLGADFDRMRTELQSVSSLYRAQPERAVARLWDILWRILPQQSSSSADGPHRHPAIAKAMDEIDIHLAESIEVTTLARSLEISQTHLNRLFKTAVGTTVGEYIRSRRLDWAKHLLCHTTLPIKTIAYRVGIPDPQHFNKMMKRYFGCAPSAIRISSS